MTLGLEGTVVRVTLDPEDTVARVTLGPEDMVVVLEGNHTDLVVVVDRWILLPSGRTTSCSLGRQNFTES